MLSSGFLPASPADPQEKPASQVSSRHKSLSERLSTPMEKRLALSLAKRLRGLFHRTVDWICGTRAAVHATWSTERGALGPGPQFSNKRPLCPRPHPQKTKGSLRRHDDAHATQTVSHRAGIRAHETKSVWFPNPCSNSYPAVLSKKT